MCRRRTQQVVWTLVRYGRTYSVTVVNGCSGAGRVMAGYRVDTRSDAFLLIIDRLTLAHAGTYTCQDLTSSEERLIAQLVVLGLTCINYWTYVASLLKVSKLKEFLTL